MLLPLQIPTIYLFCFTKDRAISDQGTEFMLVGERATYIMEKNE